MKNIAIAKLSIILDEYNKSKREITESYFLELEQVADSLGYKLIINEKNKLVLIEKHNPPHAGSGL